LIHFNSGSCNGCDIEFVASKSPMYDLERFGILVKGSPRHADILVVTGPVSLKAKSRLLRIYHQIPEPKYVIAVGSCAATGAPFCGSYSHFGGVNNLLPVDIFIGGCPPKPEAIINGIIGLIESR
jgi:Ni,Fe-hydrogenase III small subunit